MDQRGQRGEGGAVPLRLRAEGLQPVDVEIDRARRQSVGEENAHAADQDEGDAGRIESRMQRQAEAVVPEGQGAVQVAA